MATTTNVPITPGSGANVAAFAVSRDSATEDIQAIAIVDATSASPAVVDSSGNLHVATSPSTATLTTGPITSATSTVVASTVTQPTVNVTIHGTYAGVNLTFEASDDGTNFYPVIMARSDSTAAELTSGVLATNQLRAWTANVVGFTSFRVRATAWTSGTATINISATSLSTEPLPMVTISGDIPTLPVSIAAIITSTISSSSGVQSTLYSASTLAAATNSSTATMNYCNANTVFFTGTGSAAGTVTIYGSSDNTTFFALPAAYQIAVSTTAVSTVLSLPPCRYYRIQSTVALSAFSLQFQGSY